MFVQHLRAGGYTAVIYGSGRVLMGREKKVLQVLFVGGLLYFTLDSTVFTVFLPCVGYTVFTTDVPPSANLCLP